MTNKEKVSIWVLFQVGYSTQQIAYRLMLPEPKVDSVKNRYMDEAYLARKTRERQVKEMQERFKC